MSSPNMTGTNSGNVHMLFNWLTMGSGREFIEAQAAALDASTDPEAQGHSSTSPPGIGESTENHGPLPETWEQMITFDWEGDNTLFQLAGMDIPALDENRAAARVTAMHKLQMMNQQLESRVETLTRVRDNLLAQSYIDELPLPTYTFCGSNNEVAQQEIMSNATGNIRGRGGRRSRGGRRGGRNSRPIVNNYEVIQQDGVMEQKKGKKGRGSKEEVFSSKNNQEIQDEDLKMEIEERDCGGGEGARGGRGRGRGARGGRNQRGCWGKKKKKAHKW